MNETIIHIGFHKSASTFLQQDVFPNLPIDYLFLAGQRRCMLDMVESDTRFDENRLKNWVNGEINKKYPVNSGITVLSHEELSGHPHGYRIVDPIITARNLKKAYPNAKILIVIRNQFDYLTSIYTYRVAIKGEESRSFKKFLLEEKEKGLFDHIEYHRIIEYYFELFQKDRVLVLPMEELKANADQFLSELRNFMGIKDANFFLERSPRNVSTKLLYVLAIWRPINYIFHHILLIMLFVSGKDKDQYKPEVFKGYYPFIKFRRAYYSFKKRLTRRLNKIFLGTKTIDITNVPEYQFMIEKFGKSNAYLEDLVGVDLRKLGYPSK